MFVPVVDTNQKPLMPTTPARARKWIASKKATPFWKKGIFCVRLNVEPSSRQFQEIAVGIDPGSKKEGYTVKSELHTYLNIQADAVTWVKEAVATRSMLRRSRRNRKTPYRCNRMNHHHVTLTPSTRARWQWKLRICNWLKRMYPINTFIVEDIKAWTKKNSPKWNQSFSPLEVGKNWFYEQIKKLGKLKTKQGYETKELRDSLGLSKSKKKLSNRFDAHCVDSWVIANSFVGGHIKPDNEKMILVIPLRLHRRQLHVQNFIKGGIRKNYGSTRSMGFKRGSIVEHIKYGLAYIGGTSKKRITLHKISTGERICRNAIPNDCTFKTYTTWRAHSCAN